MEAGLQSIKDAVEELKLNPPSSSSGVLRFQVFFSCSTVALPPSPKALNWFCAHPPLSGVFPRFFLSKETGDPSCKTLHLNRTHGVLGIGAAIYFTHSSCSSPGDRKSLIRRYISSDTVGMTAYGFEDVNFQSSFKLETGSVYFCIPEIELDELVDTSILSATLAWNDSTSNIIRQAIQSLELSLHEANYHFWTATERSDYQSIASALGKANLLENGTFKMFSAQVELLEGNNYPKYSSELKGTTYSSQFCFRLSPTIGISYNMLDLAGGTNYHLQHHPNINAVWAALIVEECTRLGLTFFCIAPGSRSSPLAIAASSHHKTTCIACFDERALAFHAVGYSKASQKPAVIITSSGTAVSNLLPAVVEASQEFVPLLLLTADRPPELQDTGANQTINQVNHFGSFVRFFFNLPVPSDDIPARMVLTTLDSAVNWATSPPYGPVHINCPFREPLDDSPKKWVSSCLTGLDSWMCKSEPFTKYIKFQHSRLSNIPMLTEVIEIIQGANRGLLLICALDDEDEIWAALILAKHLHWPVVADILSGLRLRKVLATCPGIQENIVFLDHLDHILLSKSVKRWIQFDVILQIGTRITSKRISQMLEECNPFAYIIVDNHPCRHDPSHVVSHRIQSSIVQFVDNLMKVQLPHATRNFSSHLQALNEMVAWDISFQIAAERSLTEPHVAQLETSNLHSCRYTVLL
ncbi:Protein PHYLLO, chloroplastic [Linum grandiflorum]